MAIRTVHQGSESLRRSNVLQAENNRLQRAALNSHLEEVMMGLDRHFVAYPQVRRYFYASPDQAFPLPTRAGRLQDEARGTAELIIDFADDVGAYSRMHLMTRDDASRWAQMVRSYFDQSPVTRQMWASFDGHYYDSTTACVLGAPYGLGGVRSWSWRANRPRARWPRACG